MRWTARFGGPELSVQKFTQRQSVQRFHGGVVAPGADLNHGSRPSGGRPSGGRPGPGGPICLGAPRSTAPHVRSAGMGRRTPECLPVHPRTSLLPTHLHWPELFRCRQPIPDPADCEITTPGNRHHIMLELRLEPFWHWNILPARLPRHTERRPILQHHHRRAEIQRSTKS